MIPHYRSFHTYELWNREGGTLVDWVFVEHQAEWGAAPWALLDRDRDIIATYTGRCQAVGAARGHLRELAAKLYESEGGVVKVRDGRPVA